MITILKIFIKIMEAGIAFSLTIGILLAYYRTKDPQKKRKTIVISFVLGFIAAIISAIVRSIPNFINRTSFNFWSMVPVVLSLILMLLFMGIRKKKENEESKKYENIFSVLLGIYIISSFFYYVPALFTQLNSFVYYGESAVSTMVLFRVLGYIFGILMIILSGIAVYNTGIRLKESQLQTIVLCALLIRGIIQCNVIVQRLYSLGLLPKSKFLFALIAGIVNHENGINFVMMAILAVAPMILWRQNQKVTERYRNKAELRKIKSHMRNRRHWAKFFLALMLISFVSLTALKHYENREEALSPPEEYEVEEGHIVVPLEVLEDDHLHRYIYHSTEGVDVRFFLIKKSENSYGVVLDACEICGPSGYFERKDEVVCKLCDVVMNRGTIGFKGGCNPIPIPYIVHDQKIKIQTKDLDAMSYVFQ